MKYSDIKDLTVDELRKRGSELREELFELKMKNELGQVANPLRIREVRRGVARVKTALSRKLAQ